MEKINMKLGKVFIEIGYVTLVRVYHLHLGGTASKKNQSYENHYRDYCAGMFHGHEYSIQCKSNQRTVTLQAQITTKY
jgi:hypothetical protein